MNIEKEVFGKLFQSEKTELQSQKFEFSIIDELKSEYKSKGLDSSDSDLFTTLRNKSKTALVDLGTIANKLKPIEAAIMTLNDDTLKRQLNAFKVDMDAKFKKHKKLEALLNEAAKA